MRLQIVQDALKTKNIKSLIENLFRLVYDIWDIKIYRLIGGILHEYK